MYSSSLDTSDPATSPPSTCSKHVIHFNCHVKYHFPVNSKTKSGVWRRVFNDIIKIFFFKCWNLFVDRRNPSTINKITCDNKLVNKKFSNKKQSQTHSFSFRNNLIFTYYLNIFQRLTITIRMEKWICLKHKSIYITKNNMAANIECFHVI